MDAAAAGNAATPAARDDPIHSVLGDLRHGYRSFHDRGGPRRPGPGRRCPYPDQPHPCRHAPAAAPAGRWTFAGGDGGTAWPDRWPDCRWLAYGKFQLEPDLLHQHSDLRISGAADPRRHSQDTGRHLGAQECGLVRHRRYGAGPGCVHHASRGGTARAMVRVDADLAARFRQPVRLHYGGCRPIPFNATGAQTRFAQGPQPRLGHRDDGRRRDADLRNPVHHTPVPGGDRRIQRLPGRAGRLHLRHGRCSHRLPLSAPDQMARHAGDRRDCDPERLRCGLPCQHYDCRFGRRGFLSEPAALWHRHDSIGDPAPAGGAFGGYRG